MIIRIASCAGSELMAEDQDLEVLGGVISASCDEEPRERSDDEIQEGHHRRIVRGDLIVNRGFGPTRYPDNVIRALGRARTRITVVLRVAAYGPAQWEKTVSLLANTVATAINVSVAPTAQGAELPHPSRILGLRGHRCVTDVPNEYT